MFSDVGVTDLLTAVFLRPTNGVGVVDLCFIPEMYLERENDSIHRHCLIGPRLTVV